jgi:hypothetical protein
MPWTHEGNSLLAKLDTEDLDSECLRLLKSAPEETLLVEEYLC